MIITRCTDTLDGNPVDRISRHGQTVGYAVNLGEAWAGWVRDADQARRTVAADTRPALLDQMAAAVKRKADPVPLEGYGECANAANWIEADPARLAEYIDHIDLQGGIEGHQGLVLVGVDEHGDIVDYDLALATHCLDPNCCDLADHYWMVPGIGWVVRD